MSGAAQRAVLRYLRRLGDDPAAQGIADADLLQRFVSCRDEAAFELLLWRHAAMVLGVCRGVLRDPHEAEDAFQTTFLAPARKAGSIGRGQSLGGWLYQVAFHAALKARQRSAARANREPAGLEADGLAARDAPNAVEHDLVALMHQELNGLPARYRIPLVLCYLDGKTHAEAARDLGWAKGTVSGRLARGRDLLRGRLLRRGAALSLAGVAALLTEPGRAAVPSELLTGTLRGAVAFAERTTSTRRPRPPRIWPTSSGPRTTGCGRRSRT
jgi:RNA polymerase sigma factor (sigma-70 family)